MKDYLDPKNDFIFKCIFGGHPELLISFLNALMPLEPGRMIESLEYISNEMVPENPMRKHSIVDVLCKDNCGRHFIVEMQMEWSISFLSRMLFNASKAYVRQLYVGDHYELLQPVYALGILNENYDRKTEEFYHRYQVANRANTDEVIEGLEVILIELKKFRMESWADRKMAVLWLRFLREVKEGAAVSADLLENRYIGKALAICERGAFSQKEMAIYDKIWDDIRTQKSLILGHRAEARAEGKEEGLAEGEAIGLAKGERKKTVQLVLNCARKGMTKEEIAEIAGISAGEVDVIIQENKNE